MKNCCAMNCIMPPHLLRRLLDSKDANIRASALNTMLTTASLRGERRVRSLIGLATAGGQGRRTVLDCQHGTSLPSAVVGRTENGAPSGDASVNQAFEGFGKTRTFYKDILARDSIDNHGMRLNGYVHYRSGYNNAFWDGQQMVFGDGDGQIFTDFTSSLDVIAHELTHGVTEHTAGLEYHNQPGALNESISDVFGSLVKQWSLNQTASQADWLIGSEVFTPDIQADALRSMKAPGSAYDNELLGKDPQPDHMDRYQDLPDNEEGDYGGVHINSGIPNKAFYLAATGIGGFAWQDAGAVWYQALLASDETTDFKKFAETTAQKAGQLFGSGSNQQKAVAAAWNEVGVAVGQGIRIEELAVIALQGGPDPLADLAEKIEQLTKEVHYLVKERAEIG
jgi:Zn-dependent metalloprotease